ncbi:uncharacterized protein C2orf81 homolog [Amia ocellicauda]|uniref:uncharacterized protein C2orf81 homolog n=1 Tax=Amia ocellicauda TaxID=2972642 RepID=UPI0034644C1B
MSRFTSKSRADKSRVPSAPVPPSAPSAVAPADIVPGRLTESDWVAMLMQEEGEEVVADIVDKLMSRVMEECYRVYLQRQLVPFTVSQAREALLQMVEWRFLVRDEGEGPDSTSSWEEDEEPQPCSTDSWAQGCVPVLHTGLTPRTTLPQAPSTREQTAAGSPQPQPELQPLESGMDAASIAVPLQNRPAEIKAEKKTLSGPKKTMPPLRMPAPPPKTEQRSKQFPHQAPLPTTKEKVRPQPLRESHTEAPQSTQQEGLGPLPSPPAAPRPPLLDATAGGRSTWVGAVQKLDPARLPRHRIWPAFEVLEANALQHPPGRTASTLPGRARQEKWRAGGQFALRRLAPLPPPTVPGQVLHQEAQKPHRRSVLKPFPLPDPSPHPSNPIYTQEDSSPPRGPLPLTAHLLLDSMELSPGVSLKDPRWPRTGSWRETQPQPDYSTALKPIRSTLPSPLISLDQLVTGQHPLASPHTSLAGQT